MADDLMDESNVPMPPTYEARECVCEGLLSDAAYLDNMVNTTPASNLQRLFMPLRRLLVVDRVLYAQLPGNLQLLLGGRREDDLGTGGEG